MKQNNESTAKFYFRKAVDLHVNELRALVDDEGAGDSDDDDLDSEIGSVSSPSITGVAQKIVPTGGLPDADRNAELKAIRDHLRLLKLALQRAGALLATEGCRGSDYEDLGGVRQGAQNGSRRGAQSKMVNQWR